MAIRKHSRALGLILALAISGSGSGIAYAQAMMGNKTTQGHATMGSMMGGGQSGMGGMGGMGAGMMEQMMSGGMMACPMMGGDTMGMMSMLDNHQRSEMRELMQKHRPAQFERMGQMMNLRDDLTTKMLGDRPDPDEVQRLHGQMAKLQGEIMAEMVRMRNAIHDLVSEKKLQLRPQATPERSLDSNDHKAHH